MRRAAVLAVLVAAGSTAVGAAPAHAADDRRPHVILLGDGVRDVDRVVARKQRELRFTAAHRYRSAVGGFAAKLSAGQVRSLRADPAVAMVVPDVTFTAAGKNSGGRTAPAPAEVVPTGVRRIGAASAAVAGAPVAVLDTGVDLASTDLVVREGANCVSPGSAPADDNGHGTHVAGTIGAKAGGGGVVGVAPGTPLYAVKILNSRKTGTLSQILCGIDWVTANAPALGIRVANMSLSGPGSDDGRCGSANADAQHKAICRSVAAGVTYVASAGNASTTLAGSIPGAYAEVLTATAMSDGDGLPGAQGTIPCSKTERDDRAATYSNHTVTAGDLAHAIAAPGTCVVSTARGGGTATMTGTSQAAPHVAGAAARCLLPGAPCAGLAPAQVLSTLRDTATSAGAARGFAGDPFAPIAGKGYGPLVAVS